MLSHSLLAMTLGPHRGLDSPVAPRCRHVVPAQRFDRCSASDQQRHAALQQAPTSPTRPPTPCEPRRCGSYWPAAAPSGCCCASNRTCCIRLAVLGFHGPCMLGRLLTMCFAPTLRCAVRPCVVRSQETCSAMSASDRFLTPMGREALLPAGGAGRGRAGAAWALLAAGRHPAPPCRWHGAPPSRARDQRIVPRRRSGQRASEPLTKGALHEGVPVALDHRLDLHVRVLRLELRQHLFQELPARRGVSVCGGRGDAAGCMPRRGARSQRGLRGRGSRATGAGPAPPTSCRASCLPSRSTGA